jgi:hypothetical protein
MTDKLTGKNEVLIQRPVGLNPWSSGRGNVWISMKPKKILDQYSKAQGTVAAVALNEEFRFLAPLSLNENIVHHWEAYESVASRLAQKARSLVKLGAEGAAMTNIFENKANLADDLKNLFAKKGAKVGTSIESFVSNVYSAVPGSRIPKIKVDTPLYYTNSDRRQIVFEFVLYHEGKDKDPNPEKFLVKPIQKLMKYSSPDLLGDINIEFPFMWEIKTIPNEFIKYSTCALVGVQPTWNSPYIQHVPTSVNLQLTFLDMSPLYRSTIEDGSVINVISKTQSDARNRGGVISGISNVYRKTFKPASQAQPNPDVHRIGH